MTVQQIKAFIEDQMMLIEERGKTLSDRDAIINNNAAWATLWLIHQHLFKEDT
jgi:hypothetical protein